MSKKTSSKIFWVAVIILFIGFLAFRMLSKDLKEAEVVAEMPSPDGFNLEKGSNVSGGEPEPDESLRLGASVSAIKTKTDYLALDLPIVPKEDEKLTAYKKFFHSFLTASESLIVLKKPERLIFGTGEIDEAIKLLDEICTHPDDGTNFDEQKCIEAQISSYNANF